MPLSFFEVRTDVLDTEWRRSEAIRQMATIWEMWGPNFRPTPFLLTKCLVLRSRCTGEEVGYYKLQLGIAFMEEYLAKEAEQFERHPIQEMEVAQIASFIVGRPVRPDPDQTAWIENETQVLKRLDKLTPALERLLAADGVDPKM